MGERAGEASELPGCHHAFLPFPSLFISLALSLPHRMQVVQIRKFLQGYSRMAASALERVLTKAHAMDAGAVRLEAECTVLIISKPSEHFLYILKVTTGFVFCFVFFFPVLCFGVDAGALGSGAFGTGEGGEDVCVLRFLRPQTLRLPLPRRPVFSSCFTLLLHHLSDTAILRLFRVSRLLPRPPSPHAAFCPQFFFFLIVKVSSQGHPSVARRLLTPRVVRTSGAGVPAALPRHVNLLSPHDDRVPLCLSFGLPLRRQRSFARPVFACTPHR